MEMTQFAQLLSRPVNFAIVQLPERSYPGVVIQGDTLMELVRGIDRAIRAAEDGDMKTAIDNMTSIRETIHVAKDHLLLVCEEKGIGLR